MPSNESGLVAAICRRISRDYPEAWQFKVVGNPYQMTGVPDLLLCVAGRFVGIEVKFQRPGESFEHAMGRVSSRQWVQIWKIRQAGGTAGWACSVEMAMELIEESLEGGDGSRPDEPEL